MSHLCLLAGVTSLTLTSMGFAGSTTADLQARLDAAEARIAELSAAQNQDWLSESRADEIRGLVHDVLADADTRASLQGNGASAGYNGGFTVGSGDGSYSLTVNGVLQQRWVHSDVDDGGDADDGFDSGLTALQFSGSIGGDYGYDIRLHYDDAGDWDVAWGYGTVDMGDGMTLSMGDMKVPLNREWMTNAEHQLGMDRSWTGSNENWRDNTRGISLGWGGDSNKWTLMYGNNDGDDWAGNDNSWNLTVRGDWLLSGNWGDFDDFSVASGGSEAMALGVAWSSYDGGDGNVNGDDDSWNLGVDLSMNWDGSGGVAYNDDDAVDANAMGWVAQWSTWLNSDWELYVRYESYDADTADSTDDAEIWGIGVNQYWAGHNARWTTELGLTDGIPTASGDWLASDDDQMLIRTQLQFAF